VVPPVCHVTVAECVQLPHCCGFALVVVNYSSLLLQTWCLASLLTVFICLVLCYSIRTLVIWASDGSVWVMGLGEQDRNANVHPVRVQTDYHAPRTVTDSADDTSDAGDAGEANESASTVMEDSGDNLVPYAEVDPVDGKHYLVLPHSAASASTNILSDPGAGISPRAKFKPSSSHAVVNSSAADNAEYRNKIFKSHQRVAVVTQEYPIDLDAAKGALEAQKSIATSADILRGPTTVNRAHFPLQGLYDVVLHNGEAYLLEMSVPMAPQDTQQYRVLQYSAGWLHKLMVVAPFV
jgi:hypothetical protein